MITPEERAQIVKEVAAELVRHLAIYGLTPPLPLTEREREIAVALAIHGTTREAAGSLKISRMDLTNRIARLRRRGLSREMLAAIGALIVAKDGQPVETA